MVSIDISEAGFEQRTRHLSERLDAITLTRAFSLAVSAGNLTDEHPPKACRAPLR